MSVTTCPIFRPTLEEFRNFKKYIRKIELESTAGICKVIPPAGWWTYDYDALDLDKLVVPTPVRQVVTGRVGTFNVDLFEVDPMTAAELRSLDQRVALVEPSYAERERKFWRSLGVPHPQWPDPIYGADMPGSLFDDDEASSWNLNSLDSLLTLVGSNLPGITSSYMYIGMWRALFAFHCEDMDLYSINYLHHGARKSWYSIPLAYKQRFESIAESYFTQEFRQCSQFLRHKTKMFSPSKLKQSGIECVTVLQSPGEFVVTFPGCYHAGFSHGFNIAEATNFGTPTWLETGRKAKRCVCRPHSVSIDIDLLQTLWLRQIFVSKKPDAISFPKRMRCACGMNAPLLDGSGKSAATNDDSTFACCACYLWCHKRCVLLGSQQDAAPLCPGQLLCHICYSLENEGTCVPTEAEAVANVAKGAADGGSSSSSGGSSSSSSSSSKSSSKGGSADKVPDKKHASPNSSRKRKKQPAEEDGHIPLKAEVAVLLQGAQEEVFGIITDIEGGENGDMTWGRLHIKGQRKQSDFWVPFDDNIRITSLPAADTQKKAASDAQPLSKSHDAPPLFKSHDSSTSTMGAAQPAEGNAPVIQRPVEPTSLSLSTENDS